MRGDISVGLIRFTDTDWQTNLLSNHEIKEVGMLLNGLIVLRDGRVLAHKETDEILGKLEWMIS